MNTTYLLTDTHHVYDHARQTVTQNIRTTHIVYVTSTLQPAYFNNFTDINFIIPLFGTIIKL